jgi:hypothetical protein
MSDRHPGPVSVPGQEAVTRRSALSRAGKWSLGVAVACSGVAFGGRPAQASTRPRLSGEGCCDLYYSYYCSGQAWSQGCGTCTSSTNDIGEPNGKWWWTCKVNSTTQRFCGECYYGSCSYTYTFAGTSETRCNANGPLVHHGSKQPVA